MIRESEKMKDIIINIMKNIIYNDNFFKNLFTYSFHRKGTVKAVNGKKISITYFESPTTQSIVNNSRNLTLSVGDIVQVLYPNGSSKGAIVDFKL